MSTSYKPWVDAVRHIAARDPVVAEVPAPCDDVTLTRLRKRVSDSLSMDLPREYLDFLKESDGLCLGAAKVYGSTPRTRPDRAGEPALYLSEIVDANDDWRPEEGADDALFLGEDDLYLYGFDTASGRYARWGKVPTEIEEHYDSFGDMIAALVRTELEAMPEEDLNGIALPT